MAYCTHADVYRVTGLTLTQVSNANATEFINKAQAYVDAYFNTTFETKQITQVLDGNGSTNLYLGYYPLITLDALTIDGTTVTTSSVYKYTNTGRIVLGPSSEKQLFIFSKPQQITVQYTYGYGWNFASITERKAYLIRDLTADIASMDAIVSMLGGMLVTGATISYTMPELSMVKVDQLKNFNSMLDMLQNRINMVLKDPETRALQRNAVWV
jgi:hypothetical protein